MRKEDELSPLKDEVLRTGVTYTIDRCLTGTPDVGLSNESVVDVSRLSVEKLVCTLIKVFIWVLVMECTFLRYYSLIYVRT